MVEHLPPTRLQLRGSTSSMEMLDTITLSPDGAGTRVVYHVQFTPQGAAKLAQPLMPVGLKQLGDDAAQQMQQCLDALVTNA